MKTARTMTKSPVTLAKEALHAAKAGLAGNWSHYSRKDFTQSQDKRSLGSALRARWEQWRQRGCLYRILTHDLVVIRRAA